MPIESSKQEILLKVEAEIEHINRICLLLKNFVKEIRQMPDHLHHHEIVIAEKKLRELDDTRAELTRTLKKMKEMTT